MRCLQVAVFLVGCGRLSDGRGVLSTHKGRRYSSMTAVRQLCNGSRRLICYNTQCTEQQQQSYLVFFFLSVDSNSSVGRHRLSVEIGDVALPSPRAAGFLSLLHLPSPIIVLLQCTAVHGTSVHTRGKTRGSCCTRATNTQAQDAPLRQ